MTDIRSEEMEPDPKTIRAENQKYMDDIRRARDGDEDAFVRLLSVVQNDVWIIICYRVARIESREDMRQNIYFEIYKSLPKFKESELPFKAWVAGIAKHLCTREYDRTTQRAPINQQMPDSAEDGLPIDHDPRFKDTRALSEEEMVVKIFSRQVMHVVAALDEKFKRVLVYHYCIGLTYEEISMITGENVSTLRSWANRGLERLKKQLAADPRFIAYKGESR